MKRFLFLTCVIMGNVLFAQDPAPVSMELAKTAALHHAAMNYEKASFHAVTPYYDLDGNITVYCIVLKKESGISYSESQIMTSLYGSHEELIKLRSDLVSIQQQNTGKAEIEEQITKIKAKIEETEKNEGFKGDYITVLAGANKNHVPIIM